MLKVRVLRAFVNTDGKYGNPVGIVEDGAKVSDPDQRLATAAALGYSESVFIEDVDNAVVRMYSARREVPFAGHAAIGVAWLLTQMTGEVPAVIRTGSGEAHTWITDSITWVRSSLRTTPAWWQERLESRVAVESLNGPLSAEQDMTQLWAWEDEAQGTMRVRTFASRAGIDEDEACGTGAMRMAATFGRPLTLHHGKGSVIHARPGPPGYADIGGLVAEDAPRTVTS